MEQEELSCGRGLAQAADVPAGLAAVAAGLAQNLEVHIKALGLGLDDDAGVQEREVYERISRNLRSATVDLKAAATEMASAVDLPVAAHDMTALTTREVLDAFERSVAAEDELRRLLDARHVDNEQMLMAIRIRSETQR